VLHLRKLAEDFDPTNKLAAMAYLQERQVAGEVVTGLLYIDESADDLNGRLNTVDTPLNSLNEAELCPGPTALAAINAELR
jgi:2-oxoglutarate/2-oxoacid ferredoxin oxidoreductase subunit beta